MPTTLADIYTGKAAVDYLAIGDAIKIEGVIHVLSHVEENKLGFINPANEKQHGVSFVVADPMAICPEELQSLDHPSFSPLSDIIWLGPADQVFKTINLKDD